MEGTSRALNNLIDQTGSSVVDEDLLPGVVLSYAVMGCQWSLGSEMTRADGEVWEWLIGGHPSPQAYQHCGTRPGRHGTDAGITVLSKKDADKRMPSALSRHAQALIKFLCISH